MRLSSEERREILDAARAIFGENVKVRLFGSRVDDRARGGDIDLHVEVAPGMDDFARELTFIRMIEDAIGEQKIDVVLLAKDKTPRPIDEIALRDGVLL